MIHYTELIKKRFIEHIVLLYYFLNSYVEKSTGGVYNCPSEEETMNNEPKTTLEFSPADSLESSMSLVSAGISQSQASHMSQRPATSSTMSSSSTEVTEVIVNAEKGTREKRFKDGSVEVWYSNGNRKEINTDGSIVTVYYYNGDMKETHKNGLIKYLYNDSNTWHTKYPDGRELTQFSNGQTEVCSSK